MLGRETIGPVSNARVAMLPLRRLQQLAGLEGRLTRVLVETTPGQEAQARAGLAALARRHHLALTPTTADAGLLAQALGPSDQATSFFAAISALLGFLLAFNAMLLTAPERRRMLAELRIQGFKPRQLVGLLLFQALVLGTVASLAGLVVGSVLSRGVFNASPDYLAPAFTLGTSTRRRRLADRARARRRDARVLPRRRAAAARPAPRARGRRRLPRGRRARATRSSRARVGGCSPARSCCVALATAVLLAAPSAALVACGLLALATVLAIPRRSAPSCSSPKR